MVDFGLRLKEIRKSKGITQKQLATAIEPANAVYKTMS